MPENDAEFHKDILIRFCRLIAAISKAAFPGKRGSEGKVAPPATACVVWGPMGELWQPIVNPALAKESGCVIATSLPFVQRFEQGFDESKQNDPAKHPRERLRSARAEQLAKAFPLLAVMILDPSKWGKNKPGNCGEHAPFAV